jgi:hypothetical protein
MSDRCYMTIQCSKKDYDEVLHEYFAEILDEDGSYVEAADSEANYAYTNEMEEWVKQGLIFTAFHDVGGNYGERSAELGPSLSLGSRARRWRAQGEHET